MNLFVCYIRFLVKISRATVAEITENNRAAHLSVNSKQSWDNVEKAKDSSPSDLVSVEGLRS